MRRRPKKIGPTFDPSCARSISRSAGVRIAGIQGRHPLQTSDAIGAAAAHLGPEAVTLAVVLNKQLGLPLGKIATLMRERFGLTITCRGLVHAVRRAAPQAAPTGAAVGGTRRR